MTIARALLRSSALVGLSLLIATCSGDSIAPPVATQLVFQTDPAGALAGTTLPPIVVEAQDASGKLVTGFGEDVTLTIETNPGGGTLDGTTTVTAVGGVATFDDLMLERSGAGYRLQATAGSLSSATSAMFTIDPGPATQLAFSVEPSTLAAGTQFNPAVQVSARDALGNTADDFGGSITVAIETNPTGGTLTGASTMTAVAGVATFSTLSLDIVGVGYTFTATTATLPAASSGAFDVIAGPAAQLIITEQPTNATATEAIAPAVEVTVLDGSGNVATGYTGDVALAIGTNPGVGTLFGTATVQASGGVATFSGLSIDKAGAGYTLAATASGLTGATSAPFDIAVGAATQLTFTVGPATTIAGASISPAVEVTATDAGGNTVTGFTGAVTVAIGSNPASGALSGTTTINAVAGVASFTTLSIDKSGAGYTLSVTAPGLNGETSASFDISPGPASQLVLTVEPSHTVAGIVMSPAVVVTALDGLGNTASGFTGDVTMAIGTNPAGGTLAGATTMPAVSGIAVFSTLSIAKAGSGYTLSANASGLSGAASAGFDIVVGAATQVAFTVQPGTTTAGAAITPAVRVSAVDFVGNTVTSFTGDVTLAIGTNPASGTLSGTLTVAAVGGIATFATLSIETAGDGYTLTAAAAGLAGATSDPFDIGGGAATQLVVTAQPTSTTSGAAISPAVQVTARDALGNRSTGFVGTITLSITTGTGTGGAVLSGTKTVAAVAGIATFSTLNIDRAGTGYTLSAAASGLSGATTDAFDIAVGAATQLAFTAQPTTTTAGAMIAAVEVTARDAGGNTVTSFTGDVTLAIGTNPGTGTLSGSATVTAVAGVATFTTLSINKSGTGYTLSATAAGFSGATSGSFNINPGVADLLTITVQPTTTVAGQNITPAVEVTALDVLGNVATGFSGTVTIAIGTNPSGGTLSGTKTAAAVAGVASFSTLKIDKAGVGYTLAASATGPTGATSASFDILVGAAGQLVFTVQPAASTTAGATITPAIQVTAHDAAGNPVPTFSGTVTVAITSGTGTAGAVLSGTLTVGAASGVATFSTLSINKSGTGYRLTATSSGVSSGNSATFVIIAGVATQLGFTVQPVNTIAGRNITPAVRVAAQDALGNTVTSFTSSITVAIGTNPSGGILGGTKVVTAVAGVATFSTLTIDKTGIGYTLTATRAGLTTATSTAFNITPGTATKLAFTVQPVSTAALASITPAVQVTAQDALGNTATGFTSNVTVGFGTNPAPGSVLSGTKVVAAVAGVATFSNLSIDLAGNGYTLMATASGLTAATSASFDITTGAALVFTVNPTTTTAGATITPAIKVTARDAGGATVTTFVGNVTVAIAAGTGAPGATLSGTTTVAAVAGVATFSNLSIDKSSSGYRLVASANGFSTGTSSAFTINAGPPTQLGFIVQPSNTPAGALIIPGVQVAVQDALGNRVSGISGSITVAIGTNPSSGTLAGTLTQPINAGAASFPNLSINNVGTGYTLTATSAGYVGAGSGSFNVTAAATTTLAFTFHPSITTAGVNISPAVEVTAQNSTGGTVTSFTGAVTIMITAGAGANGATLSGTKIRNAIAGVVNFDDLSIDKAGTGYKLSVTAAGVAGSTSNSFVIIAAPATQLVYSQQPTATPAGASITPAVEVSARDQFNNVDKNFTGNITVAIVAGTGTPGAVLSGTKVVAAIQGLATFSNLSINLVGTAYKLGASAGGLPTKESSGFAIQ
ncbi:MAG: beta strand repeat-containing protein [Gemmatimonadales bacterium]